MAQQPAHGTATGGLLHEVIAQNRTWFMILGVVLIVLGVFALAFPLMTTIAAKTFLGWLFLIGGVIQIIHAFSTQKWSAFFFNLLVGVLYFLTGVWLAFFPLAGIITLTVLLAAMFLAQGILEIVMALRVRALNGWIWILVSGLIGLAVGVLILAQLPSSAVWAIGLLVGINMISSGWAYFFLALGAGRNA
jgi:uncharacterized membrane protein HdeD (DUF308 family)